jgi:regulator of replication initiation timing
MTALLGLSLLSSLRSCGPLAYSDNECAKQLLYARDDSVWGMKITALEKSADFATLDTEKLFSKLNSHELSRKGHPNHDVSIISKAFITSARIGGHDDNPINTTVSSILEFVLSSLATACDEQYESIPDDEIVLLVRKFHALHMFRKEMGRSPRGCFECGDTTHFIIDCPKRKKLDSSNKYDYNNQNDSSSNGDNKKKYRFRNRKKKFQNIVSRACAALSDINFSSDDSSNSEEDEKVKRKQDDFTGPCLMSKSSRNIFNSNSNSNVSDDLSIEDLSMRIAELKNALCNQDKLLCKVFHENKKLNLELESVFSEIASFRSMHDDMSTKPCDNCNIIMVNYVDLWHVHSHIASLLGGARLKLRELKARSTLLRACTSCPLLISDLEASAIEIKHLKHKLDHSSRYNILSPLCDACGSLKDKLFHTTKENIELKHEVTYLTSRLERTIVSEKMIENDLSQIEESATKSTYKLDVRFERCEDKGEQSAPKSIPSSNYHKEEVKIKSTKTYYSSNPKSSFNLKREVRKEIPKLREEAFVCMFCGCVCQLDVFSFWPKRIEKRRLDYCDRTTSGRGSSPGST